MNITKSQKESGRPRATPFFASILFVSLITFYSLGVAAASPVWKVSKGDQHIYLGGTIHLLAKSDYPLPPSFNEAYKKSAELVFETNLTAIESPDFLLKLNQLITYDNGKTLITELKPETYKALNDYFLNRGMDVKSFSGLTPTGIMLTISMMELQLMGLNPALGVEKHFSKKARQHNKRFGHLESPEEHLSFITKLGGENKDQLVMQTLNDLKTMNTGMEALKKAWREGDNLALEKLALNEMKKYPETYQSLLVNRNHNWIPKIEAMLKDGDIELILVGALHLVGEDGVLNLLKDKGYILENI